MFLKPITIIYTDSRTNIARFYAILPNKFNAILSKPKYRRDMRPTENSQSVETSVMYLE